MSADTTAMWTSGIPPGSASSASTSAPMLARRFSCAFSIKLELSTANRMSRRRDGVTRYWSWKVRLTCPPSGDDVPPPHPRRRAASAALNNHRLVIAPHLDDHHHLAASRATPHFSRSAEGGSGH
jgi:hypothetical protein